MRKMTAIRQSAPKKKKQRVAAYCRVSTDRTEQQHSFEMQRIIGINEEEAKQIRRIFEMRLNGTGVYAIGKMLYEQQIPFFTDTRDKAIKKASVILYKPIYTVTINAAATDNIAVNTSGTAGTITLKSLDAFRTIDSNSFVPVADGLYIFKRNTSLGTPTTDDFQYSGYYVKTIGADKHYFALEYDNTGSQRSDYVLSDGAITTNINSNTTYTVDVSNVKMFTASQDKVDNAGLTWTSLKGVTKDGVIYTTADDGMTWRKGTVTLDSTNDATLIAALNNLTKFDMFQVKRTTGNGDNVLIDIALANLGSGAGNAEKWTAITDTDKTTTFYYNNDLEEGATTAKLVDSMTMDSTVTKNDYIAFDFDLNVKMESIQVTVGEDGNEGFDTVSPWSVATAATYSDAKGETGTVTNGEIELIAWS